MREREAARHSFLLLSAEERKKKRKTDTLSLSEKERESWQQKVLSPLSLIAFNFKLLTLNEII